MGNSTKSQHKFQQLRILRLSMIIFNTRYLKKIILNIQINAVAKKKELLRLRLCQFAAVNNIDTPSQNVNSDLVNNSWDSQMRFDQRNTKEQHKESVYLEPTAINMESVTFLIITLQRHLQLAVGFSRVRLLILP